MAVNFTWHNLFFGRPRSNPCLVMQNLTPRGCGPCLGLGNMLTQGLRFELLGAKNF